jgi:hypothetical protein
MALSINPNFVPAVAQSAIGAIGVRAAQMASPAVIQAAQKLFGALSIADSLFGKPFADTPLESIGYLTPNQVKEFSAKIKAAGPAKKSIFYVRITDGNSPKLPYGDKSTATGVFDLLVLDVTYSAVTLTGERVNVGSGSMDKLTGSEATEVQITTMDDKAGTLKRWFDAKASQATHDDGTFGLPSEYVVNIEIVHGVASPETKAKPMVKPYSRSFKVRPVSCSHELSKREHDPCEIQMTFTQLDTWLDAKPFK